MSKRRRPEGRSRMQSRKKAKDPELYPSTKARRTRNRELLAVLRAQANQERESLGATLIGENVDIQTTAFPDTSQSELFPVKVYKAPKVSAFDSHLRVVEAATSGLPDSAVIWRARISDKAITRSDLVALCKALQEIEGTNEEWNHRKELRKVNPERFVSLSARRQYLKGYINSIRDYGMQRAEKIAKKYTRRRGAQERATEKQLVNQATEDMMKTMGHLSISPDFPLDENQTQPRQASSNDNRTYLDPTDTTESDYELDLIPNFNSLVLSPPHASTSSLSPALAGTGSTIFPQTRNHYQEESRPGADQDHDNIDSIIAALCHQQEQNQPSKPQPKFKMSPADIDKLIARLEERLDNEEEVYEAQTRKRAKKKEAKKLRKQLRQKEMETQQQQRHGQQLLLPGTPDKSSNQTSSNNQDVSDGNDDDDDDDDMGGMRIT